MRSTFILLVSLLSLSACSTIRQHPEFANSWNKQYSVTVVPTKVMMKEFGLISQQDIDVDASGVDKIIGAAMEKGFAEKGYIVKRFDMQQAMMVNPDIKFHLKQLHDKAKDAAETIEKNEKGGLAEISVGPIANYFSSITGTDLIVVPLYVFAKQSAEANAFNVLLSFGAGTSSMAGIRLMLVDGKNGNVMWTNHDMETMSLIGQGLTSDPADIALANDIVEDLMETLPDKRQSSKSN